MKYEVKSDAVAITISADSRDHAAKLFAMEEGFSGKSEMDLREELENMDGWLEIIEY